MSTAGYLSRNLREQLNSGTGASSDVESKKRIVPALKYDNPNPNGKNLVKFDYDYTYKDPDGNVHIVVVDRKLNITTFEKALSQLRRMAEALKQNPSITGVIEVPNQAVYNRAVNAFRKAGIGTNQIQIRITPQSQ